MLLVRHKEEETPHRRDSTSEPDRKRSSSFDAAQSTPPPPADMFRRCNSFPVISTAAAVKPVDLLSRLNACTVVSPATAKRPPPAPSAVLRSFSDVTPATAIRDGRSTQVELVRRLKACTVSSPATAPDGGNRRDSPNASPHQERMLKEIKAGLEELMNRVDCITGGTDELFNDSDDENHVEELNGEQESGVCETVAFMHKCDCGKQFQVFLTAKSV
ncbi:hypothetical protein Sjap_012972 [Stephania japonica]|uniref:Uncharacterized protein n=1 Tax=Stephania japonica TaxID=461633 RepID=A0AAP0NZF7_9MAGN